MNHEYTFGSEGFFGYAPQKDFYYYSLAHFLPIILLGIAIFLTYRFRDKLRNSKHEENIRFALGATCIFAELFYFLRLLYVGAGTSGNQMINYLPIEVCQWMAIIAGFMMMKKSRHMFDLCYYICLTLGVMPLIMPAVIEQTGPGYFRYYQFWAEHLTPIYCVFYMMFVQQMRPDYKKVYKPFILLAIMASIAIPANLLIPNGDFMYLQGEPAGNSILTYFPKNLVLRLLCFTGIVIALFTLVSLPQIIREIKAKKAQSATATEAEPVAQADQQ